MKLTNNELYEVKALAFRIMTGQIAPGKDPASGGYSAPYEERVLLWEYWETVHAETIRAMIMAIEQLEL